MQALEQLLAESAGIADEPRERWRTADEGIHVFAAALYHLLQRDGFEVGEETIGARLKRELTDGALQPGNVRWLYEEFYGSSTDDHDGSLPRTPSPNPSSTPSDS